MQISTMKKSKVKRCCTVLKQDALSRYIICKGFKMIKESTLILDAWSRTCSFGYTWLTAKAVGLWNRFSYIVVVLVDGWRAWGTMVMLVIGFPRRSKTPVWHSSELYKRSSWVQCFFFFFPLDDFFSFPPLFFVDCFFASLGSPVFFFFNRVRRDTATIARITYSE